MSNLEHQNYLDSLFETNKKFFMGIIDLGLFINDIKLQISDLDNKTQIIDSNIKNLQSQLKTANKDEKARLVNEIKQTNLGKKGVVDQKNYLIERLNNARVEITRRGNEEYFTSVRPGNKLFVDYVIDNAVNNKQNVNKFIDSIKDYMQLKYMSNVAKDKIYDLNSGTRFEKIASLETFQRNIHKPSIKKVLGDQFLRQEIGSYLNNQDAHGGKRTRKYNPKKISRRRKLSKRRKSNKKYRK